jgi:hypothetical protein
VRLDSGAVTTILSLLSELAAAARCIFVTAWQPESGRREIKWSVISCKIIMLVNTPRLLLQQLAS